MCVQRNGRKRRGYCDHEAGCKIDQRLVGQRIDLLAIETRFEVPHLYRGCAEVVLFGPLEGMNRCPLIEEIRKLLQIVHEGRKNLQTAEREQCNTTQGKTVHRGRTSSLPPVLRSPTNISTHPAYLPPTAPTHAVPSRRNNRSSCPPRGTPASRFPCSRCSGSQTTTTHLTLTRLSCVPGGSRIQSQGRCRLLLSMRSPWL